MELTTDNIQELNRNLIEIISSIKALEDCGENLIMDSDDVAEMFGWSKQTAQEFMSRPDFPLIKIGKKLQVNRLALIKYTMRKTVREERSHV